MIALRRLYFRLFFIMKENRLISLTEGSLAKGPPSASALAYLTFSGLFPFSQALHFQSQGNLFGKRFHETQLLGYQ